MDNKKIYNLVILRGILLALLVLLISIVILAVIYSFIFTFSTEVLNKIILILSIIIVLFTGFYIARRVENYGWLNGGLGGMIFMGIVTLLGSLNVALTLQPVFFVLILGLILGSIGGMIGINLRNKY